MALVIRDWNPLAPPAVTAADLGENDIWLWTARVPATEAALGGLMGLLNAEELARAEKFRVSAPRRQFVLGRAILRQILGACLQVEPASLVFGYQPAGKPFLLPSSAPLDFRFNLSHSGETLAIALTRGRDVGVDVEWVHALDDWSELESRILSKHELAELHSLPPLQRRAGFFNAWTRKEAWLKATGQGLIDDLPAIEVTLAPGRKAELIRVPGDPAVLSQWSLYDIPLDSDYAGAVVVQNHR